MKKILIIEDDTSLSQSLSAGFRDAGFEAFLAEDGEVGLQKIQEKKPDLILLDLILPKKHGFKVLEELQASPELKKIPVLVLTNLETPQDIERAFTFGIKGYLVKANYSLDEIVKKAVEVLTA
jgi:DNA-binding response OmpR family regulator